MVDKDNWIWIDLEMTGLNPDDDRVLELAAIVTTPSLEIVAESPVLTIHQSDEILNNMDDWCIRQHEASGLTDRVRESIMTEAEAEQAMLSFLKAYVPFGSSPICGNSICQDRRFLWNYMPELESFFHYRQLDVSTVKILVQSWYPDLKPFNKVSQHRAIEDIRDSIEELRYYHRKVFFPVLPLGNHEQ